jgi:colanic acid/amylovoran biosynthesis glycosyltransferase
MPASVKDQSVGVENVSCPEKVKVSYLITTFPKLTELFLQREIRALRLLPVELSLYSLWGGGSQFDGLRIHRFPKARAATLLWWLPYWLVRKPAVFLGLFKSLARRPMPSWTNFGETLIGIAFAVSHARRMSEMGRRPDVIHAAWATMPATAARLLHQLTGIPFTMSAHAYDVFKNGGDWLLPEKVRDAAHIATSTQSARVELIRRGADSEDVSVVLGGLFPFPRLEVARSHRHPLRILSVGRLVEKKGQAEQLSIYAEMQRRGIAFEARMIGDGPLAKTLRLRIADLDLTQSVTLTGSLSFDRVLEEFAWADVLVFTGRVAADGDRDGLPNVILEAMATGTPVVTNTVAGIPELVEDGRNGVLLSDLEPDKWIRALLQLRDDDVFYGRLRREGREVIEKHFDARFNTRELLEHFRAAR